MSRRSPARSAFDQFVRGYVDAALWSSTDNADASGGRPLDDNYTAADIARASLQSMKRDCARFVKRNRRDLASYCELVVRHGESASCMEFAGHDFWLTRNGHGSGFWDRDGVGESGAPAGPTGLGARLTDAAHAFGTSDIYVGDDGRLYVSPENRR